MFAKNFRFSKTVKLGAIEVSWGDKSTILLIFSISLSISKPKILFLDEPTLGLDVIARRELWRVILKLKGQITIILTTHYLEEIEALCDRILIMSKGKVLAIGTSSEIKDSVKANNLEDAFVTIVKEDKHEKNVNLFE